MQGSPPPTREGRRQYLPPAADPGAWIFVASYPAAPTPASTSGDTGAVKGSGDPHSQLPSGPTWILKRSTREGATGS